VVGSGVSACKKIGCPAMPINVTVTNSGRIALPEIIKNVAIYTSSFKIKFQSLPFFTWAVTAYPRCSLVKHT